MLNEQPASEDRFGTFFGDGWKCKTGLGDLRPWWRIGDETSQASGLLHPPLDPNAKLKLLETRPIDGSTKEETAQKAQEARQVAERR